MISTQYRPAEVYCHLQALMVDGRLEPEAVVDAAADPDHPLHHRFEWDDSVAAHQYRLKQARHLITSVRIHVEVEPTRLISCVAYTRDSTALIGEQGYREVVEVKETASLAERSLKLELDRIEGNIRRSLDIAEVLGSEAGESASQAFRDMLVMIDRLRGMLG